MKPLKKPIKWRWRLNIMVTDALHLELVTPDACILSEGVEMVVIPGDLGDFGVMAHHAPVVSTIRPGMLEVQFTEAKRQRYFIGGGYANVVNNQCTVLAESLIPVEQLEKHAIQQELNDLREAHRRAESDMKRTSLDRQILEAETKLIFA
jgi:F-type H+-transporting ATPase subunit epsilon